MNKPDLWDVLPELLLSLFFWNHEKNEDTSTTGGAKGDMRSKIVSNFSAYFSKVDEGIWISLITKLDNKQKATITRLLKLFDLFRERDSFRLTVVNAPLTTIVVEETDPTDKNKKIKKVVKVGEYSDQDPRVIFLKDIADLVDDPEWGPEAVRDMLRTHELATENKVAKHALAMWDGFLSWMHKTVCELFEVESLDQITWDMITEKINLVANKIPERKNLNPGWWRWMFQKHLIVTLIVIAVIAVAIAASLTPPPIH